MSFSREHRVPLAANEIAAVLSWPRLSPSLSSTPQRRYTAMPEHPGHKKRSVLALRTTAIYPHISCCLQCQQEIFSDATSQAHLLSQEKGWNL